MVFFPLFPSSLPFVPSLRGGLLSDSDTHVHMLRPLSIISQAAHPIMPCGTDSSEEPDRQGEEEGSIREAESRTRRMAEKKRERENPWW